MILGDDWLKSCTPIELDYEKMTFTINLLGKRVNLQALTSSAGCKVLTNIGLYWMIHIEASKDIAKMYLITSAPTTGLPRYF